MKLLSIQLFGYIGIKNGTGRDDINIDFSKSRHNICLIKGGNGSGKSTLMNAMSPLPDDNSSFTPGVPARKCMMYTDGIHTYFLQMVHELTNSGERATAKAYFREDNVELNSNGNITSYRDLVFDRFGMDANFEALSKLSSADRGLADKKPAQRKKFVSSIMDTVEVYNDMHKTLSKNSSVLKTMMTSITAKINSVGDENLIKGNIDSLTATIKDLEEARNKTVYDLAYADNLIASLDPDGKIQENNNALLNRLSELSEQIPPLERRLMMMGFSETDTVDVYKDLVNSIQFDIDSIRSSRLDLIAQSESKSNDLNSKINKMKTLTSDCDYSTLSSTITSYKERIASIEEAFRIAGIDTTAIISSAEYETAIMALNDIRDLLKDLHIIHESNPSLFEQTLSVNKAKSRNQFDDDIKLIGFKAAALEEAIKLDNAAIYKYKSECETYAILQNRPSNCKIDSCPFIAQAMSINYDPQQKLIDAEASLANNTRKQKDTLNMADAYEDLIRANDLIARVLKIIQDNNKIFSKIKSIGQGKIDSYILKKCICAGADLFSCKEINVNDVMSLLDKAYILDEYTSTKADLARLESEQKIFVSKHDLIDEIQNDIDKLQKEVSDLNTAIYDGSSKLDKLSSDMTMAKAKLENFSIYSTLKMEIGKLNSERAEIESAIDNNASTTAAIETAKADVIKIKTHLKEIDDAAEPAKNDLNRFKYSLTKLEEYKTEFAEYKSKYEKTETVKYYASPTTGIQIVFMEMYMNKIISTANDLISNLFGGVFLLQPFVITGDEFRIPCIGNAFANDDISSMSTGEICMISMILSFSILFNSATKYNILRLDEIDGGLDTNNRVQFINTLSSIMGMLNCEQCFIISHNDEIQFSNVDFILLGIHDTHDYPKENVIFIG